MKASGVLDPLIKGPSKCFTGMEGRSSMVVMVKRMEETSKSTIIFAAH